MRASRRAVLAAVPFAVALLGVAPAARAGEVPKYGALPAGHLSTIPTAKAPASIGAREKVPGFFPVRQKFGPETPVASRHISVVSEQAQADAIRLGTSGGDDDHDVSTCFSEADQANRGAEDDDVEAHEWSMGQLREVNLWPRSKDNDRGGVAAVHTERVVETNGQLSLESVDAWVDPVTLGARLIGRASLPLVQVGTALGGVKVYAGRDERSASARFVQFVVVRPSTAAVARAGTMMAMRQDGSSAHGNGCGHLRMPLVVGGTTEDSAVVIAPIEIAATVTPPLRAEPPPEKAEKGSLGEEEDSAPSRKAKPRGKRRRPAPSPAPSAAVERPLVERESRTRDIQIHLSVSQTAHDKEPLLAVSFGWAGRESVQRTTVPEGSD